jgi:hypothetical protein
VTDALGMKGAEAHVSASLVLSERRYGLGEKGNSESCEPSDLSLPIERPLPPQAVYQQSLIGSALLIGADPIVRRLLWPFRLIAALAVCVLGVAGCEREPRAVDGELVWDSAGIRIVENPGPRWPGDDVWVVAPEPQLEIGSREGDEASTFYRLAHAARLSDGRILVLDGSTLQLRYFGASGEFLHRTGRRGSGPGEFQVLSHLQVLPADSVLVYDARQSRVTLFDAAGRLAQTTRLTPPAGMVSGDLLGRFPDGSFAVRHVAPRPEAHSEALYFRDTDLVIRYHPSGGAGDTVASFAGRELTRRPREGGLILIGPAPFGRQRHYLMMEGSLLTADSEDFHFFTHDGSGRAHRLTRLGLRGEKAPAELWQRIREASPRSIPVPETMPAFRRMLADPNGNLWVEHYRATTDSSNPRWEVTDRDGRWVTSVRTPPELQVTQFGADYVLGTVRDSLDTEYVRLHALVKHRR